ncbi:typA [Symbiodinium pilosum]|uniref:TypA protein n=1 Tax=Symbiodinium pilosum TaxID=2952 RepID=A0A812W0U4_SYMPI|nr:typA [Symbiodinium pilosum]
MPRQENATDVHAEAIRQRQVDVSFGLATLQGDMLTSADESDTNPDPVNYTEAEILDLDQSDQTDEKEPVNSTAEDCYLPEDSQESPDAFNGDDYEDGNRHDDSDDEVQHAVASSEEGGLVDEDFAILDALQSVDDDVSGSETEEEDVGDIGDETKWWGWAERERVEGRTQAEATPAVILRPPVAARRRSPAKRVSSQEQEWYYNAEGTKVGKGEWDKACDQKLYFCAGQTKYGAGIRQAQAVKAAIENHGVHPEKADCLLGKYWCKILESAGISKQDRGSIRTKDGEWQFKSKGTKVGFGSYKEKCPKEFKCAGGTKYGLGIEQAREVKKAIENGGVHPDKVVCTLSKYWCLQLQKAGIPRNDAGRLTAKGGEWYFKDKRTQVGYGSYKNKCDSNKVFCAGRLTFGFGILQAKALKEAIENGGLHPDMVPCKLGKYWCPQMKKAGIRGRDIVKITFKGDEWYFDGQPTRVGYGSYKKHCDSARLFCAGGTKFGFGILQARAVNAAIADGGIHPAKANYRSFKNFCVLTNGKDAPQDKGHVTKNVAGCEAACDLKAGCTGFEWYANGWNRKNCFLFIDQPLAKGSPGKQWKDAMCYIKKARRCTVFPKWRKKWLGKHVQISLGAHKYGAKLAWKTCFELCESEKECKQVVWSKSGCFGMLARSDADQDNKGGKNTGYMSAHCYDKDILHFVRTCGECGKSLCQGQRKNEKGLESSYMIGAPLHSWGCANLWAKPYGTVRNSESGAIYVVDNPAEQAAACPFLAPHFGALSEVLCEDGKYVKAGRARFQPVEMPRVLEGTSLQDWSCMKGGHGQRAQCPANSPVMCARQSCHDLRVAKSQPKSKQSWVPGGADKKDKCEEHGKRLCTYSELCQKRGQRPAGGLQSVTDAWCPILEEDMKTPNYAQVGATMRHPTCKKLTESHRLDATSWPLSDERLDLREVFACCEGWVGRGSQWRGQELSFRQQSLHDRLTIQGKPWHAGKVYFDKLPSYLSTKFPMRGTQDVNTGNSNELFLAEPALVYLLRVDRWSGVPLDGWTNTGDVGSFLGPMYAGKVRVYWKLLDAGKHVIDNYSGMYLVSSPSLPSCVGSEGLKIPHGFVWPEKYPSKADTTIEEVWASNRKGVYGRKVQGMKFAALTLKETQDNGGAYYILFSNRPPSDKALRPSDCSAGTSIKYGTKPKSKVRNSGEFVPTWLGTTWKVYMAADLWEPFGSSHSKCLEETPQTTIEVADQSECQMHAVARDHRYYQILRSSKEMWKCMTTSSCDAPMTGTVAAWQIYSKDGAWQRHGPGSSCGINPSLEYKATGHCTNGLVYSSRAWELAESKWGRKDFTTDQYKAWMKTAWANCLLKDPGTTFVSVWTDAGYRCFKTFDCKPNGATAVRTWSAVGLSKAFVHLRVFGGTANDKTFLSTITVGTKVDLFTKDDFSGRQRWVISKGSGDWYTIRVLAGVNSGRIFLSTTATGDKVDLIAKDDASGRQRWKISRISGDWYHITVVSGVSSKRRFLSTTESGDAVDLREADDGSGRQRWLIAFEANAERLTSWQEHNFNDRGISQLSARTTYTYRLSTGYTCLLTGWTHTRTYARGFLRASSGTATATVKDLEPGGLYVWRLYQFASFGAGTNILSVNSVYEGSTTSQPLTTSAATKLGMTPADMQGRISFVFSRRSFHVQLSGLTMKRLDEVADEHLTSLEENHFNSRGDSTLNEKTVYSYVLGHGYKCDLTGFTHTRKYAHGFLRNKNGEAKATISGLEPGAEYAFKVYQYAAQFAGKNLLFVNGDSKGLTTASKSAEPTKIGLTQADGDGKIIFTFGRIAHHVHLSGLAIGRIASNPVVFSAVSFDMCQQDCLSRPACTGFELKGGKCALWSAPLRVNAASKASECVTLLPQFVYPRRHTGHGGDNTRWRRGPGGPKGTDVGNGESQYAAGPYEVLHVGTRRLCEKSCSQRSWCAGYAFKHTKSFGSGADWKLGVCQLVDRRIPTATKVTEVASFSKAGAWQSHGNSKCQAVPKMLFKEHGHCTKGQIYSSNAWELAFPLGRQGFSTPEYATWLSAAWRKCKRRDPDTSFVSVWTDAGYRCYKTASCGVKADGATRSWTAVGPEKLSSLAEQNFNDRAQRTLNVKTSYTYKLSNGYTCTLREWTHTRTYAKGFLRNKPGTGLAIVSGLQPGEEYVWQLYQYAALFPGKNAVEVNGIDEGLTSQSKSDDATLLGMATASTRGEVVFGFKRNAHHVHLSGLAIRKRNEARTELLSSLAENSFHMRRRSNRNLDRNNGYVYPLSNGYNCELKGWTQSRDYAKGVLRNVVGKATAVVSGLEPGALYSWKVYQYASKFGGHNGLSVNGESMGLTWASKRTDATKTGAHRASADGRITFAFQRKSAHVHLSGIALGKVYEAGDEYLSSISDNNFNDRGNANLNPVASYAYKLSNGYSCTLKGWTHSRLYAKGFLRNRAGTATAVVSGLEPGKLYAWRVYQYAAVFGGRNRLRVNGGNYVYTTAGRSDLPTRIGLAKAKSSGQISFEFVREAHHVHLSALAIARVREAEVPQVQEQASSSLDACKLSCEKKADCQGIQYDSPKKRCSLWSSPFESAPAGKGVECLSWRRL